MKQTLNQKESLTRRWLSDSLSGMRELWKELACVLAGLLAVAAGLCEMAGGYSRMLMILGAVVAVLYAPFVIRAWMAMRSQRRELAKLGTPARMKLQLPYHELSARFQALARVDEGVLVSMGYLSWASPESGKITITREGESDWNGLYWINDAGGQGVVHGLALYRKGVLAVYPASAQALFETAFMNNILLPQGKDFRTCLSARGSGSRK